MRKITILLSSILTLSLIIGNNASAAAFIKLDGIQAQQPNKNSSTGYNQKRNRLGDDISGYGYKNILKKGNVFRGNVRVLPNRNSGGRLHNNGAFLPWHRGVNKLHGNSSGDPLPVRVGKEKNALIPNPTVTLIPNPTVTLKGMVQMPQESQNFLDDKSAGVTTLEHGPGISNQPKGVQLKFINGIWTDGPIHGLQLPLGDH